MMCVPKETFLHSDDLKGIRKERPNWCPLVEVEQRIVKVLEDEEA